MVESTEEVEDLVCEYPNDRAPLEETEISGHPGNLDISRQEEHGSSSMDSVLAEHTKEEALEPVEEETVNIRDKDLNKTWLDRAITTILEKLDEARKRPF